MTSLEETTSVREIWKMPSELMLKIEDRGMFTAFIFYAITGVVFLALLPLSRFPPHIGILGIWSLATAYGLLRKRKWTLYFIAPLFFVATTFSLYTIYGLLVSAFFEKIRLWSAVAIAYLVLSWVLTAYVVAKRSKLTT